MGLAATGTVKRLLAYRRRRQMDCPYTADGRPRAGPPPECSDAMLNSAAKDGSLVGFAALAHSLPNAIDIAIAPQSSRN